MIKIEHLAVWTFKLEEMRRFYETYFNAKSGEKYHNKIKNFESYFLSFDTGTRLELMQMPNILQNKFDADFQMTGLAHFAISVGTKEAVVTKTEELRSAGVMVIGEPRTTGDGYYESVILDPDNNRIEITI